MIGLFKVLFWGEASLNRPQSNLWSTNQGSDAMFSILRLPVSRRMRPYNPDSES